MKKLWIWLVIGAFFLVLPVNAQEYNVNELIAVDEVATVKTEKFDYIDFTFSSQLDEKGNGVITFQSITNNTLSKNPVSINILLFDGKKENIGFLTYCSNKDYDSSYSGLQLGGKESTPFAITAYSKYFGESKKTSKDVRYIAVMDENKLCRIGGYSNYLGKTMEQILNPEEPKDPMNFDFKLPDLPELPAFMKNQKVWLYSLIGFSIFLIFVGTGAFFNVLYKKMYGKKTFFAYLPVTNIYVSVKSVFGRIVAIIFFLCVIASGVLYYFNIKIALYIMAVLWLISIILIIVKLITKNYDLFYFEPSMDTSMEKKKEDFKHISKEENTAPLDLDYKESVQDISSDSNISSGAVKEKEEIQETEINLDDSEDEKKEEGLDDFF
ncbi:MAG: hypothetical protein IJI60_03600 [Bacilli bacterium]|nr:hypothetical protein [Bacilli bacterium]